jgi:hypothetical protein
MFKKVLVALVVLTVITTGIIWWRAGRNTPQAVAKNFTHNLTQGKTDAAYMRLTFELTTGRENYWHDYLNQFADPETEPTFGKEDQVIDAFNTYTEAEAPHRFTYTFHLKHKGYQMVFLLIKEGKTWKVDELYGSDIK